MSNQRSFRYFKTSPEIIQLAVMIYGRFLLSLRNVEDLLHERGIDVSHESVRYWWHTFGLQLAPRSEWIWNAFARTCQGCVDLSQNRQSACSPTSLAYQNWTSKAIADAGGWKSPRLVDETYIHTNEPAKKAAELFGKKLAKKLT